MFGTFELLAGDFLNGIGSQAQFSSKAFHLTEKVEKNGFFSKGQKNISIKTDQVESLEVATEDNLKKMGGSIVLGLVGGALLGGVGAIAGLLAGGRSKEVTFICKFKDGRKILGKCDSKLFTKIQAACF